MTIECHLIQRLITVFVGEYFSVSKRNSCFGALKYGLAQWEDVRGAVSVLIFTRDGAGILIIICCETCNVQKQAVGCVNESTVYYVVAISTCPLIRERIDVEQVCLRNIKVRASEIMVSVVIFRC